LNDRSGGRPYDEKLEISPAVACGSLISVGVQVIVVSPAAMRASMTAPSAAVMATTGIVIAGVPATVGLMRPAAVL
jgi:hypothetical protein